MNAQAHAEPMPEHMPESCPSNARTNERTNATDVREKQLTKSALEPYAAEAVDNRYLSQSEIAFAMFLATSSRDRMTLWEQKVFDYHLLRSPHPDQLSDEQIEARDKRARAKAQQRWRINKRDQEQA